MNNETEAGVNSTPTERSTLLSRLKATTAMMRPQLAGAWRRFREAQDGNFMVLFALTLPVTLFMAGGAIDFMRVNAIRTDMVESCDAAGLAIARLSETPDMQSKSDTQRQTELTQYGKDFFEDNFRHQDSVENLSVGFAFDEQTIRPEVSGDIRTLILRAAYSIYDRVTPGQQPVRQAFSVNCGNEITLQGSGRVELALVVDVSGSMNQSVGGEKKIESLRTATDALLDVLYGSRNTSENVRVGVVPFNHLVRAAGSDDWDDAWNDDDADSAYHGDRFFHVTEDGEIDTDETVNHFTLFDSTTGAEWNGCLEARPYPLDEMDIEPGDAPDTAALTAAFTLPTGLTGGGLDTYETRTANALSNAPSFSLSNAELTDNDNTYFVPMFHADETDCDVSGDCNGNSSYNNYDITVAATPYDVDFRGFWFDNPSTGGHTENNYNNQEFIDDSEYASPLNRSGNQNFERYLHMVDKYRDGSNRGSGDHGAPNAELNELQAFLNPLGNNTYHTEYIMRQAYVGWYNDTTGLYEGKYNLNPSIDETPSNGGNDSTRGPNMGCPAPVLNMTNDRADVEDHMDELVPFGWTNSAVGAMWGQRLVSPEEPYSSPIPDDDGQWQKAVVIMTDGENTVRGRDTHYGSHQTAYGYAREERMGDNVDTPGEMRDEIDDKFLRVCHRMKERGYLVYTIMFDLNSTRAETLYRACATAPGEPYFYEADDGLELEEAFEDIAADLVKLHISR